MDAIEYNIKLSTNNPTIIAQTISKLCDVIEQKCVALRECGENQNNAVSSSVNDIPELKYLKLKCGINNKLIALTASQGINTLVEKDVLPLRPVITDLISALPHSRCYSGIIATIIDLLTQEVSRNSCNNYKLLSPQHPLITILLHDFNTWSEILQMVKLYIVEYDDGKTEKLYNSLKCVFFFIMCNPDSKIPVMCQSEIWKFLLHKKLECVRDLLLNEIFPWIPINSTLISFKAAHLIALSDLADKDLQYSLAISLSCCIYNLIKQNESPTDSMMYLHSVIRSLDDEFPYTQCLFILTEACYVVPAVYLRDLLRTCKALVHSCNTFSILSLKAALLHWLMFSCALTNDCKNDILQLLSIPSNTFDSKRSKIPVLRISRHSEKQFNLTLTLCELIENWNNRPDSILKWLRSLSKVPLHFLSTLFSFLSGIFLWKVSEIDITCESLSALLRIVSFDSNFAGQILTLVLHKLSNEKEPRLQLILLDALPKLTVLPQNLPIIVHTIYSLSNGPETLKIHAMKLFFDLWIIEPKCYTHLQKIMLCKPDPLKAGEFYLLKAYILKEICLKRPEVYGTEMVNHLSDILNKCSNNSGSAASALAIQGIMHLCTASIIDVPSTWNALAPKFKLDSRPGVVESLCNFFAEIPECYVTPEKTDILDREVIDKLWELFDTSEEENVLLAVAKALGKFNVDKIVEQAPERYLEEDGKFHENWIKVIDDSTLSLKAAGNLMISLIASEIREFRGGVYLVPEGRKEPNNYNYLPTNSVLRAIGNYVARQSAQTKDLGSNATFRQCLRILSKPYSKPLPPLDWCFLHELIHFHSLRYYVLTIAAHQILLSGTARRIIDNFIAEIKPDLDTIDDVMIVFKSLKYICNGIQPSTLQPFIKTSLDFALKHEDSKYATDMLTSVKESVADKDVHLANKSGIADILKTAVEGTELGSSMFPLLLECITELEDDFIYLVNVSEEELHDFEKMVKIRAKMAQKRRNLKHFNDCIDSAANETERKCVETHLIELLLEESNSPLVANWLSDLLGRIQAATAEDNRSVAKLTFLCDLYLAASVVLSGSYCLCVPHLYDAEKRFETFPLAVASLLKITEFHYQASQIIEWLHYMINYKHIPLKYRTLFYQSLMALKYENVFQEKWLKYAAHERPTE